MKVVAILAVVLGMAVGASVPARADTISVAYTLSGTFAGTESSAPLSGPNGTFSVTFTLGGNPSPGYSNAAAGDFAVDAVAIVYSFQCSGCLTPTPFVGSAADVVFAANGGQGELVIEFLTGLHDYYLDVNSSQLLFSGTVASPTLLGYGTQNLATSGQFELDANSFTSLSGLTLTAVDPVSTPEPSEFLLLLIPLLAVSVARGQKRR